MTIANNLYIDAVVIKGSPRTFTVSINQLAENQTEFEPFDLSEYYIRFRVLGSATADALVLIEKNITQSSDENTTGIITAASNGQFSFVITEEDTDVLGVGKFPISLEIMDIETDGLVHMLTEGGYNGEFNKLQVVQV